MMNMMKVGAAALALGCSGMAMGADMPKDFWSTPTIHGYGRIHYVADAAYKPHADQTYKIVFSLTRGAKQPSEVNPALDRVARTVNLYVASGVPLKQLKFVAVAYGEATPLVLNDTQYQAKFGVANPNLPLIDQLRKAGIDVSVCAQAVAEHEFQNDWVDKRVTLALSGLTTVTTLEHDGYVLMPL
jgi:intracellular sulfur oxidation DsrE/DsrF family protein